MNPLLLAAAKQRKVIPIDFKLLGRNLIAGTPELGYFGEFTAAESVSFTDVSTAILGANIGTLVTSGQGWFGFAHKGKRLLVARRSVRYGISYDSLVSRNAVNGDKGIYISHAGKSRLFRGRLLTGTDGVTANPGLPGGEWNALMYRIAEQTNGEWARLTSAELGISGTNGSLSWVMDGPVASPRIVRGSTNLITDYRAVGTSNAGVGYGWRPALELVE